MAALGARSVVALLVLAVAFTVTTIAASPVISSDNTQAPLRACDDVPVAVPRDINSGLGSCGNWSQVFVRAEMAPRRAFCARPSCRGLLETVLALSRQVTDDHPTGICRLANGRVLQRSELVELWTTCETPSPPRNAVRTRTKQATVQRRLGDESGKSNDGTLLGLLIGGLILSCLVGGCWWLYQREDPEDRTRSDSQICHWNIQCLSLVRQQSLLRARRIIATVLVVLLRATFTTAASASAPSPTSPLLIVGSVTSTGARILYDRPSTSLWPLQTRVAVRVFVRVHIAATADVKASSSSTAVTYELLRELVIESPQSAPTVDDGPRVLVLDDLLPSRRYIVGFQFDDGLSQAGETEEEIVRFRTPRESGEGRAGDGENTLVAGENGSEGTRVLVVSCDRSVDDGDDAIWERVAEDMDAHASSYFGMAHIGDQVYVDAGARGVPITPVPDAVWADARARRGHYDVILGAFRRVYRETFGRPSAQHVLRHGAHGMLPDDHEVLNNFNTEHVHKVFGKRGAEEGRTQEADEGRTQEKLAVDRRRGLELHCRAGLLSVDRMFFGRNYGVLEVDAEGHFEWRKSVVLAHESVTEQVIQWTLDLARPWGIITATVALVVLRRLLLVK